MLDYGRNLRLAMTDRVRRAGLIAGAGAALIVAAGFLLAALWSWLAHSLHWGPLMASLAIGVGFLLLGLLLLALGGRQRHRAPGTDELKAEIAQKLGLAADAAVERVSGLADRTIERASERAGEMVELASQRAHSLTDSLSYGADRLADRAEARVLGAARRAGEGASRRLGLPADAAERALGGAVRSRIAPFLPLIGAFAVGITLASRLGRRHSSDEWNDDDGADDDGADGEWFDDDWLDDAPSAVDRDGPGSD
jgi:vacuolar-type H+-ATPase subunit H